MYHPGSSGSPWLKTTIACRLSGRFTSWKPGWGSWKPRSPQTPEVRNEIRRLRRELTDLKKRIYSQLKPWETVEVARHPERPMTTDYLELVFDEFVELHGDKFFGDDRAIRTGWAKLDTLQGHGRRPSERQDAQGTQRLLLRLRPSRGLPQGHGQDAAGRQVPHAGDLPDRHAGGLSGHRRRGARPGPGHRQFDVRDVASAHARSSAS